MDDLSDLVREWASESAFVKQKFFTDCAPDVARCARAMTERLASGGKVLAFGNGGSATDAQHIAVEFANPVVKERPPFPAISLAADSALVTSLANDFDFAEIFSRQVAVLADPRDVLIGLSTSGDSPNVVRAFEAGRERGLLTVALTGKGGGRCAEIANFAFAVPSHNVLRIQECHLTLYHILWDMVHTLLHFDPSLSGTWRGARAVEAGTPGGSSGPVPAPVESAEASPSPGRRSDGAHAQHGEAVDPDLAELYPFLFKG
ncbi:MAG TPA: SIS domain-containing protein [Chloroflexota bacterium]|nr:SIS domain-containing protein [Chloroflexota bacterium]